MDATPTKLAGVLILEPRVFEDDRGFFFESWNGRAFAAATGVDLDFVQDNHSRSKRGILRGIHYQLPPAAMGKLVRVVRGAVYDVAVDLRTSSSSHGDWVAVELSEDNRRQFWIPPGFGHAFLTLSDWADVLYKATAHYAPDLERSIRWDDPVIGIDWPLDGLNPVLSQKDAGAPFLRQAGVFD